MTTYYEMNEDFLAHYGVLGMKWGQRRARKFSEKSQKYNAKVKKGSLHNVIGVADLNNGRTKSAQKHFAKGDKKEAKWKNKAAKAEAKSKKIENYHKEMGGTSTYNRVKNTSTGKLLAQSTLLSTYGTLKYHQARSKGLSKGKSVVNGLLYNLGNRATNGLLSIAEPRANRNYKKAISQQKKK